jgi:hypothetical protein
VTAPAWEVDPASLPTLAAVLRARLLSRVRIFEVFCESGRHRCLQVLTIDQRPFALGVARRQRSAIPELGDNQRESAATAVWLDTAPAVALVAVECRCRWDRVTVGWLREQIAAGRRRRVLDAATRRESRAARRP